MPAPQLLPQPAALEHVQPLGLGGGVHSLQGVWQGQAVFAKSIQTDDPDTLARFRHEGEVVQYAASPLVVPLLAQTPTQLIFPWLPGGNLRDLARCGPMTAEAATDVVWGILLAVQHLHQRGVVHHDLKPENVMLREGQPYAEQVRLIDFGMSYAAHLPLDIHSGTRMGTPHFMAPEQFQGIRGDPRSDLYSVGVLLFDCLAGHPPYEDALGWLVGISEQRAELPGTAGPLHALIHKAIQRDRDQRPQTAAQMLRMLGDVRWELGLSELPTVDGFLAEG